ncbi:MAG: hypothetical protein JWO13_1374 [Acidobacteriales bacterium]|nr:hypothetical protein [Terriglobales bacterium]
MTARAICAGVVDRVIFTGTISLLVKRRSQARERAVNIGE